MLSYIRESQTEAVGQGSPDDQASRGAGEPGSDDTFLTVSGRDQTVRKSTAFVTALFIVVSIGLILMAKKSHVQSTGATPAKDSQAQIEMAINRVTGVSSDMTLRMDEIVQKFSEFSDVSQVKVDDLNKNPFQLVLMPAEMETKGEMPLQDEQVKSLLRQFDLEKETLSLMSIIQSESGNCCMINGILVKTGQAVNSFVVEDIQDDHVKLVWQPDGHAAQALPGNSKTMTLALKE
jgi:preprotein translocase subunit SecG